MSESKWRIQELPNIHDPKRIVDPDLGIIAISGVMRFETDKVREQKENCLRLMAAAPELLEALKNLLPMWESGIEEPWVEKARTAIAKAEPIRFHKDWAKNVSPFTLKAEGKVVAS